MLIWIGQRPSIAADCYRDTGQHEHVTVSHFTVLSYSDEVCPDCSICTWAYHVQPSLVNVTGLPPDLEQSQDDGE